MVERVNFSILFRDFPLDHFDETAAAVSVTYQINDFDARTKIRRGWGFLERDASEETASRIAASLTEQGIGAFAVPNDELRALAEPMVMTGFQMDNDGLQLRLQSPDHPLTTIGWSDILVVAAGGFSEEVI